MATRTKVDFWKTDGGCGRAFVAEGTRKGSVFIHHSVVTPRPSRGADLTGQEIVVDGVDWEASKGPRALAVFTAAEWAKHEEARRAAAEAEEAKRKKAAEEEARRLTFNADGFLRRGEKPVDEWSVIRLVQRHSAGKPDQIEAAEVSGEHYLWAPEPISGQQLEQLIEMGRIFRRTCAACRGELLTVDSGRQVHDNNRCDEGNQHHRWENLIAVVEEELGGPLPPETKFEVEFTKPLTLRVRVGDLTFSSGELLADRCPKCGDHLVTTEEGTVKFDVCACGYRAKRFPAVREVSTARGAHWWEVRFRDPEGSHDEGYGWQISHDLAVADDYTNDFPRVEIRERLAQILQEAGAPEEVIAAARPVEPDPIASHICPECGAPVVSRYKPRREGRYYQVTSGGSQRTDQDGDIHYEAGTTVSSADVPSGTYWLCPNGHGTWWDERKVLNPHLLG